MAEQNKAAIRHALERWNQGDLEGYLQIYDPNVTLHGYQGVEPGLDSIRKFYQTFWKAFPGVQIVIEDLVAEGDKLACRFTTIGTHKGELMGIPPTGRQVTFPGITILQFNNGKCIERWSQVDFLGMMQQLGVIPAPGQAT